jgi:hypothetical protein
LLKVSKGNQTKAPNTTNITKIAAANISSKAQVEVKNASNSTNITLSSTKVSNTTKSAANTTKT